MITNPRNPSYNAFGGIELLVTHSEFGDIPFTATPDDVEVHGRDLYQRANSGEFGTVTPYPGKSTEELETEARIKRNGLLAASDWTQLPDVPVGNQAAWATYRQALRDVTAQPGFPGAITWPVQPS